MKFTSIEMKWTDKGAIVKSSVPMPCPSCPQIVSPGIEHRCGDMLTKPVKTKRAKKL